MSIEDSKVGCAVISDNIANGSSISIAKVEAIDLALDFVQTCDISTHLLHFWTRFYY